MGGGKSTTKPRFGFPRPDGGTRSYWLLSGEGDPLLDHRTTEELPKTADAVVIGSGMSGTVVAQHLLATWPSKTVVVLEARQFCSGATGRNAGHCKPDRYRGFADYAARFGEQNALKILENEHDTWSAVVDYVRANNVDCDLWVGETLDVATTAEAAASASSAYSAFKAAGGPADRVRHVSTPQGAAAATRINSAQAYFAYTVSTINPWKLTAHVMRGNLARGVNLQTHTKVTGVRAAPDGASGGWIVDTDGRGSIATPLVVHATNAYSSALEPSLRGLVTPQPQMCDRVVAPSPTFQAGRRLRNSYSVMTDHGGFYSVNPRAAIPPDPVGPDSMVVLFGGHNPGHPALMKYLDEHPEQCIDDGFEGFPTVTEAVQTLAETEFTDWTADNATAAKYDRSWSGIMGITADGVPFVGELPGLPGQWICAGHNGHGMARIFTAAPGLVKLIAGQSWADTNLPDPYHLTPERFARLHEAFAAGKAITNM